VTVSGFFLFKKTSLALLGTWISSVFAIWRQKQTLKKGAEQYTALKKLTFTS
jgi:hypothetical protein